MKFQKPNKREIWKALIEIAPAAMAVASSLSIVLFSNEVSRLTSIEKFYLYAFVIAAPIVIIASFAARVMRNRRWPLFLMTFAAIVAVISAFWLLSSR
jgi:hypothetical protein